MNRILELQQQKTALIDQAGAFLETARKEKRALTEDERKQFEAKSAEAAELVATIDVEQRFAAMGGGNVTSNAHNDRKPVGVHDNWTDNPSLFGRPARQGESATERRKRLAAGFGENLLAIRSSENGASVGVDKRLLELQQRAISGASEAVPSDGGFLIQPDFADEILSISHDTGIIYPRARQVPLSENTNAIKIPGIDEQSRADGSRWGGVRMYWNNEADTMTGSKPKFRQIELVMKKLTGLFYSTDELNADARALGAIVMQAFGEEMGFKLDDAVMNADGSGKPLGILNSTALVTVAKESGQTATTVNWENIKKMYGRFWARSRKNGVWYVNQDVEQQLLGLYQLVGTTGGVPVYLPPGGASANPYGTLLGMPVIPVEQCATLGTVGDIILADFSQYVTADKGGLQAASSIHVRFINDEMTYRWVYRVDGQPIWHTALTPYKGSNTLSPFVVCASR